MFKAKRNSIKLKWFIGLLALVIIFIIFLFYVYIQPSRGPEINVEMQGVVSQIIDGDTLRVDGTVVRLALVDTPEKGEMGYQEAIRFTASLCPVGSIAYIDIDDGQPVDRYGRTIGVVYCNGKNLNAELLKYGYAKIDERFLSISEFNPSDWKE